jgi:hypothetical protein
VHQPAMQCCNRLLLQKQERAVTAYMHPQLSALQSSAPSSLLRAYQRKQGWHAGLASTCAHEYVRLSPPSLPPDTHTHTHVYTHTHTQSSLLHAQLRVSEYDP